MDFTSLESEGQIEDFSEWVASMGKHQVTSLLLIFFISTTVSLHQGLFADWWKHKTQNSWILPALIKGRQVLFENKPWWLGPNTCNHKYWRGSAPLVKPQHCPQNITPRSCSIVSNHHFTTHVVTYSCCCRAWECDEWTAAEIESSHTTGILKNHVDLILGSGRLSRSCYTTRYDHVTHFFIYFTSSHSLLSCQPILPTLRMWVAYSLSSFLS